MKKNLAIRPPLRAALLSVLSIVFCAGSALAATDDTPPAKAAQGFYGWVLDHPWVSMPSAEQRTQLAALLSADLLASLQSAAAMESRCTASAAKGDKPDIFEGSLLVGNLEGATEVAYSKVHRDGDRATLDADLIYVDARYPKASPLRTWAWKDQLQLRLQGRQWVVHDVLFGRGGSLQQTLADYVEKARVACVRR